MTQPKTIAFARASGLVGLNIVRAALERGYRVNGTLRNANDPAKAPYLMGLSGADDHLKLFSAEMVDEGSFDEALQGVDCVFNASSI